MTYKLTRPYASEWLHAGTYADRSGVIHHLCEYSVWDSTDARRFVDRAEACGVAEVESGYGLIYRLEVTK
ncbi:hypothetical protein ACFV98_11900 [Streptomyces violascens]|uniref:hypothetical protein n=1 Tax=Streptomyces violascens TaxID=67381 RepID=UPI00365EAF00